MATSAQGDRGFETVEREHVQRGDLFFGYRSGFGIATLGKLAKEEWRHVGVVSDDEDGRRCVVEVHGNEFQHRPIDEFCADYEKLGFARLDLPAELIGAATDWMDRRVKDPHLYAMDDLFIAGIIAANHRSIAGRNRKRIQAAVTAAALACRRIPESATDSFTCSGFVYQAYSHAGCRLELPRFRGSDPQMPAFRSSALGATDPRPTMTLEELFDLALDDELFEAASGGLSIIELASIDLPDGWLGQDLPMFRSAAGARMTPDQLRELVWVLANAVCAYGHPGLVPSEVFGDGRWATPGDLWNSPQVRTRSFVRREHD